MVDDIHEVDDISSPLTIKEIVVRYERGGEEIFKGKDVALLERTINTILFQRFIQGAKK